MANCEREKLENNILWQIVSESKHIVAKREISINKTSYHGRL